MIHKTAIIDSKAKISKNVHIGPYSVIGPTLKLMKILKFNLMLIFLDVLKLEKEIRFILLFQLNDPQDLKYNGEKTNLEIGDNNKIREYVSINPGTVGGGGKTKIGNNCLLMVSSHVAHDCQLGSNIIIANNVALAGHATIDDYVVIGGNSAVQQFTRIGKMAMIGGMTGVSQDVIPYGLSLGNRNSFTRFKFNRIKKS